MSMTKDYLASAISRDELAVVYSALILADDDIPITADKINTLLKTAEVKVEPIWPSLFARALQNISVKDLISNISGAVCGGDGGAAMPAAAAAGTTEVKPPEEEKETVAPPADSDEDSDDMGLSLFD